MSELSPPSEAPAPHSRRPFRLPADYYSSPATDVRPMLPRGVPIGCGIASIVILVLLFSAGAFFARGGAGNFMGFIIEQTLTDIEGKYAKDVTPAQRRDLAAELNRLRDNAGKDRVKLPQMQPILESMRDVLRDGTVSSQEVDALTQKVIDANVRAGAPRPTPISQ
jgi:hypothetical protein